MAELIVQLVDETSPDPVKNLQRYKKGYIVEIKEDGGPWGYMESIEKWVSTGHNIDGWHGLTGLIKIPGVPAADVQYLVECLFDFLEDVPTTMLRRRNWKGDLSLLPTPLRNKLLREFVLTVTKNQWDVAVVYLGA